jgi:endonuclease/exonuclease/phosphatase family metal-dependent hydrolase
MRYLRVVTLNIWNKSGPWPDRLQIIRAELARLKPDVVGLQEVLRFDVAGAIPTPDTDQATEIAEGFGFETAYAEAADYGNRLKLGNALLTRFPLLDQRRFDLPGRESGETRCLLYCLLDTPPGKLPVFVTHLNWKFHHGSVRLEQVRYVADRVAELSRDDDAEFLPTVLMGDFNAEPDSDEIRYLRGRHTLDGRSVFFSDAWAYTSGDAPGFTFDRRNLFAARAHEPPRRIDYIFVRGPDALFRGEPAETRLAFTEQVQSPIGPVWASDHFGLVTDLHVTQKTA